MRVRRRDGVPTWRRGMGGEVNGEQAKGKNTPEGDEEDSKTSGWEQ